MKKYFPLLLLAISCNTKREMSLEELKKATWSKLDKGISYLSIENVEPRTLDSMWYTLKGFQDSSIVIPKTMQDSITSILESILSEKIKVQLKNSKKGYLKLDIFEMAKPEQISISVYLSHKYDTLKLAGDIAFIKKIPFVVSVNYTSNEMARQKFIGEAENEEWSHILKENPLPASLEIEVDANNFTPNWLDKFKEKIDSGISNIDDISYPAQYLEKMKAKICYIMYERY